MEWNGIEVNGLALCKLILISVESLAAKIRAVQCKDTTGFFKSFTQKLLST